MPDINVVVQNKGGVGKTVISLIFLQWLLESDARARLIDTDPSGSIARKFRSLPITPVDVFSDGQVDPAKYDLVWEEMMITEGALVVDTGANAGYETLVTVLRETGIAEWLAEGGHRLRLHCVLAGGDLTSSCVVGLHRLLMDLADPVVVWLNEYEAPVELDGKNLFEMRIYVDQPDRFASVVQVQRRKLALETQLLRKVLLSGLTFDEAIKSADFRMVERHRLRRLKEAWWGAMARAFPPSILEDAT